MRLTRKRHDLLFRLLAIISLFSILNAEESISTDVLGLTRDIAFIGNKECAACHSAPSPLYEELGVTAFVRLVEATEWWSNDKHAFAYKLVRTDLEEGEDLPSNSLSKQIVQSLQWELNGPEFTKYCLSCHAGLSQNQSTMLAENSHWADKDERGEKRTRVRILELGIQCETCHGPGANYALRENHQQPDWRKKTPDEKLELGMIDLGSPSMTARVCYSCHVGDIKQNRFVTHPMYAAGHPPLPPVDLATFLDAMPPHWKPLSEKPYRDRLGNRLREFEYQKEYFEGHFGSRAKDAGFEEAYQRSFYQSQTSLIGTIVANEMGLDLLTDVARIDDQGPPYTFGDFATYDCFGCHQELVRRSTNLPLARRRIPGRPYPAEWLRQPARFEEWKQVVEKQDRRLATILDSLDSTPFGRRESVAAGAASASTSSDPYRELREFEKSLMTETQARTWIKNIISDRQGSFVDYWTARQTGWIVSVFLSEMMRNNPGADGMIASLQKELTQELELDFGTEQKTSTLAPTAKALNKARQHDPERCLELMNRINVLVGEK